ncbi:hypothetical protein B2G71_20560 [Novosphingobium sp. PC22D]|uniref:LysR family transcriptional regulator n=1 Tax=Novosphingobium sp. PC22D TaxID=1962403 RepID=UPI000BF12E97|nr:LysR family transcriptional regulator [Novosphingobium sp. PC22D]PEQ10715.1 hypothetical protein B2G71_20560 [Novosphingobium sp. PC22D]
MSAWEGAVDLKQLRFLVTIANEGSFNRASGVLRIAQPALSRQIRDLEGELGSDIFFRSAAGVTLTPAGEVLYAEARRLLPQFDLAGTRFKRAAAGQLGVVQVALSLNGAHIGRVVGAFADVRNALPDVEFHMRLASTADQLRSLQFSEIDVGVMFTFAPIPTDLRTILLRSEPLRLLVPVDHPLCGKDQVYLADLNDYELVFPPFDEAAEVYNPLMSACLNGGLRPKVAIEAFDMRVIAHFVRERIGLGFCIPLAVEEMVGTELAVLDVVDLRLTRHAYAAWRAERETPAILSFVDKLRERLA